MGLRLGPDRAQADVSHRRDRALPVCVSLLCAARHAHPALAAVAIVVSIVIHDMMYGPQAAFIAESFPTRLRYSGASLGYQLAAIVSGGPAPVIASYLMHRYGTSAAISVYLMLLGAVTIAATIMLKERSSAQEEPAIGVE